MSEQRTCGPLYREGIEAFTDMSPGQIRLFTAGFVTGQAEKIYLGACQAAMFRPSEERWGMVYEIVEAVSRRYGLDYCYLQGDPDDSDPEIWMFHPKASGVIDMLIAQRGGCHPRSPVWHMIRGTLCGVPLCDIDYAFHLRKGYGVPCDQGEP